MHPVQLLTVVYKRNRSNVWQDRDVNNDPLKFPPYIDPKCFFKKSCFPIGSVFYRHTTVVSDYLGFLDTLTSHYDKTKDPLDFKKIFADFRLMIF
ncbi:hypothetical protein AVEN_222798-1 [Araneus ventricosus]|uniref:Uncharacterized protein n=1 Tax=Araneus ventricosus TaxID=182803 RepID=A0A4Y2GX27_ARAVE|nr:hypothetical protein AVEN_222798-1 [Araneus ventricosus]